MNVCTLPLFQYSTWKSGLDRALALTMLLPGLPIIAVLICLVRLTSPGPAIFRQVRVGLNGKTFTLFKIRTMRIDAESPGTGPVWSKPGDPRTTRLGRFLRDAHLDELPQLFNVLRGDMSLVGPRPERPEFVVVLAKQLPGYRQRLDVLPGITGLAQINLPPDTNIESVRKKLTLDIAYIDSLCFWLDFRLLLCTCLSMFGVRWEIAARWLGLIREVPRLSPANELYQLTHADPLATQDTPLRETRAAANNTANAVLPHVVANANHSPSNAIQRAR